MTKLARILVLPALVFLMPVSDLPALAQSWAGQGRLSGLVLDEHEQPLEGAEVRVTLADHGGPAPVFTNRKGRWSLLGLASGRWDLVVSADGYQQSDGFADVVPGPAARLRIVLRPLAEQGPTVQVPTNRPLPVELPVLGPEAHRTGAYRLRIDEASPLGTLDAFIERTGTDRQQIQSVDLDGAEIDLARESFEVCVPENYVPENYVPENYVPANSEPGAGWGLMVWVSPTNYGGLQRPDNLAMLGEKRMIWIGANWAGNYRKVWDRVRLALHAAHAMARLYDLDPGRIYAAGYSGGGRMASWLSMLYPEVFHGGFFVKGVDYYKAVSMPDKPGAHWPAAFREPSRSTWPQVKERNRYVFFTGENDFNRLQTQVYARRYEDDGYRHVHYLEEPGATHYTAFGGEILGQVIDLLDGGKSGAE